MNLGEHFRVTGGALKNWLIAQLQDSLAVGLLWLVGLLIIGVPWAPLWALLGAALPVCAPDWRSAGGRRPGADRHVQVGRLGAPTLCSDSVRGNCGRGWFCTATLHHEAHGQGAGVGVDPGADCAGHCHSVLGSACWPRRCWPCSTLTKPGRPVFMGPCYNLPSPSFI